MAKLHYVQHNISTLTIMILLLQFRGSHFKRCTCSWLFRGFVMAIHPKEYEYNHVHSSKNLGAINKNSHAHMHVLHTHTHIYIRTIEDAMQKTTIGDSPRHLSTCLGWVRGWTGRQSCRLSCLPSRRPTNACVCNSCLLGRIWLVDK